MKNLLIKRIEKEVDLLNKSDVKKKLNLKSKPIHIKNTLSYGVQSGGMVTHATGIINSLRKVYKTPIIFTTDCLGKEVEEIKVYNIGIEKYKDFSELDAIYFNKTSYSYIKNVVRDRKISFVYQRCSLYNFNGVKISDDYKVPLILEFNSSGIWTGKNWGSGLKYLKLAKKIEMLNLNKADLIVCVSEELKDELMSRGISSNKILVNYNGVDIERYRPDIDAPDIKEKYNLTDEVVIGFVGSFDVFHGTENLAKAFDLLIKEYPQYNGRVELMLIGEGRTKEKLEKMLGKYVKKKEVIFTGSIPYENVPEYLSVCDILVAPHVPNKDKSEFFGSPTKLFEYMAMGKGIVASDLNQIGRILEHEKTALLVEPDNVEQLMQGIKRLVDDKDLRIKLGKNARKEVEKKYTWDMNVKRMLKKLKELYK